MKRPAAVLLTRELLASCESGAFDPKRKPVPKLSEAFKAYLEWVQVHVPKSHRNRCFIRNVVLANLDDVRLNELTAFRLERFKKDRKEQGASPATINRALTVIKHLYKKHAEWGEIDSETFAAISRVGKLRESEGRVRWLEPHEEEALMSALPKGITPIAVTAMMTGMRMGEILEIQKKHVDLVRRVIRVEKTKTNRRRFVPIPEALMALVTEHFDRPGSPYLFVNRAGNQYTVGGVSKMFARAVAKAGISDLRFHDLRHDFATKVRRSGAHLDTVGALLGHSSLEVTKRYAHIGQDDLRDAVANLGRGTEPETGVVLSLDPAQER